MPAYFGKLTPKVSKYRLFRLVKLTKNIINLIFHSKCLPAIREMYTERNINYQIVQFSYWVWTDKLNSEHSIKPYISLFLYKLPSHDGYIF